MKAKFLIAITCIIQLMFPIHQVCANDNSSSLSIGEYITFGKYYDEPILWRCIDIDNNGPLMLSDDILCNKIFDIGGDNVNGSHGASEFYAAEIWVYTLLPYYRYVNGSNYWGDSNIRCWLNSENTAGNVIWSCGNPPSVPENYPEQSYANEAGFLSDANFSLTEKDLIKSVLQKSLLDPLDASKIDGGDVYAWKEWSTYALYCYFNGDEQGYIDNIDKDKEIYNKICYEFTEDKVFLLGIEQFARMIDNRDILGEYAKVYSDGNELAYYWIRTPYGRVRQYGRDNFDNGCRTISVPIDYGYETRSREELGIRPAFYLDENNAVIVSGEGSESSPYILSCISETENSNNASENNASFGISVFYNGSEIFFDQSPFIDDDLVLVPMRAIFEVFGANVEWNETEQLITAVKGNDIIQMRIGDHKITKNDIVINSVVAPRIVGDRTFVPLRVIAECLNADVEWIEDEQKVIISKASE